MSFTKTQVSELYVTLMGRASEAKGNQWWQDNFDDQTVAAAAMLNSDAVKAYFGDSIDSDADFIATIYKNTLNKSADGSDGTIADPAGIAYWSARLDGSSTEPQLNRAEMIVKFIEVARSSDTVSGTQFSNRVSVSDYAAENLTDAPEGYKEALSFHNSGDEGLVVTDTATSVDDSDALIDGLAGGNEFVLTTEVDTLILTNANDTIVGESSTIGADDTIIDVSVTDNDTFNIALTSDMAAATISNVENVNVTLNTLGGTKIDATNISGANITVGSTQFGFSGEAEIDKLAKNDATAGQNITKLTVKGITNGTIDTGSASDIVAEVSAATDSISLKTNGDVALDAITNDYTNLNVEATADSVLDISDSTQTFTGKATITGDKDLTLKTAVAKITTKEVINDGTGELTIELTDDVAADLKKVDSAKIIADEAFTNKIDFKGDIPLDVTLKKTANTIELDSDVTATGGGSNGSEVTVHLEAKSTTDTLKFTDITKATVDAQLGGIIAKIDGNSKADVTILAGDDLSVTAIETIGKAISIDGASTGDIELKDVKAQAVLANELTQDFTVVQAAGEQQISILGGKAKNNIETTATTGVVSIQTQDGDDIIKVANTTGKVTVKSAGGDDEVDASALEGKATIELGDGDNKLAIKTAAATADATVTAGTGVDTMTVAAGSDGKLNADLGAGNDIADLSAGVAATADITLTMGAGDDVIKAKGAGAETITFDGGAGADKVEVVNGSDFSGATITFTDIENVKIDTKATFDGDQLSGQTFKLSGTGDDDQLIVKVDSIANSDKTTDLSTITFDNTMPTGVEYVDIDVSSGAGNDTIIGASGVVNHIKLGSSDGKDTIKLTADSMGIKMVETDAAADGIKTADVTAWTPDKADFNIAVIEGFETADDSIVLGNAANASNYRDVQIQVERDDSAAGKDLEAVLSAAIDEANDEMTAHTAVEYVYVYNTGKAADNSAPGADSFLLWDTDGDHDVDAAILLVGINAQDEFDHTDIVAG